MTRRIGILGGTFDPVHVGHLEAAAVAQRVLTLGELRLMPSMTPPHRHVQPYASAFHRFAMVSLAITDRDDLIASDDELQATGPSYTSTTLARLHEKGFAPTELFFVLGSDAFIDISEWHRYPAVDEAHFVVVARPGTAWAEMRARVPELIPRMVDAAAFAHENDGRPRIVLLTASTPDVSSTEIRRRVAAGESVTGLTPPAVVNHIGRHGLYRRNSSAWSEE
jgi:nicotinate-nucleotide adenylyltransferase